jgi:hypothetical protein
VADVQIPLLSALLLLACLAKVFRVLRTRSAAPAFGPTALFPLHLWRPAALTVCLAELALGIGLLVTAGKFGAGDPATGARLLVAIFFLVATFALVELRNTRPDLGCGCFGELSRAPVSLRTLARSALFAVAALSTLRLGPLQPPKTGLLTAATLGILAVELIVIAALSPELGEGLVRLGYSEPCELRRLPADRSLAALRKSAPWRQYAGALAADQPADIWRELCWRYLVFPARYGDQDAEVVFAVQLKSRRPEIRAALVDPVTGDRLSWPVMRPRSGPLRPPRPRSPGEPERESAIV